MKKRLLVFSLTFVLAASYVLAEDYKSQAETINHYKDRIVSVKDMDDDARQFFTETYKGKDPGIIRADFNGDGKEDLAILTKSVLILFICNKRCKEIKSIDYGGFAGFQYIIPIEKGETIEAFDGIPENPAVPPVKLKHTAIELIYFGKASIAYYWNTSSNDFSKIVTGD